ncbi:UTRA domain-containing protein, partial [Streptococcus pyogenes]
MANKLGITQDSFVYEIIRLRILEKRPLIMEYTYMPLDVVPGLKKEDLERSIYAYIQDKLNFKIHSAFVKVTG